MLRVCSILHLIKQFIHDILTYLDMEPEQFVFLLPWGFVHLIDCGIVLLRICIFV